MNAEVGMKLTGSAAAIRSSIQGTWLGTVPNGELIQGVGFYNTTIQSDGYRWAEGYGYCYKNGNAVGNQQGTFQYDPAVMHPVGTPYDYIQMFLTGSAAAIRSSIWGTVLTVIPDGGSFTVREFLSDTDSYGFYWCE